MRRVVAALGAVLLLTGCVGLPDSGGVEQGEVQEDTELGDVEFILEPPAPGATQEQIVQGFLQAGISPADDFATAREYLAESFATTWDPTAGVTLRTGQPQLTTSDESRVEAAFDVVGRVDEVGSLDPIADDAVRSTFELVQEGGEWRIRQAPDGLVLTRFSFDLLFDTYELQWLTPDQSTFVPDVRWFERSGDAVPGRIVDAVLAGPVDWLAPAVYSAADPEVRRVGELVSRDGVVTVTVSIEQVQVSDPVELARLAQQLQRALGATEVVVEIDGLDGYSGSSADAPPTATDAAEARAMVLADGGLQYVGQGPPLDIDPGLDLEQSQASALTVDADEGVVAALVSGQVLRLADGAPPQLLDAGVTVAPTLDRSGWVWWVPDPAVPSIMATDGTQTLALAMPEATGAISDIEMSRDGARLAVITDAGADTAVWIAGVLREGEAPTGLAAPFRMPVVAGEGVDVTWADPRNVAVLASGEAGPQIVVLEVGGETDQVSSPPDEVTQIVGTGGSAGLWARSALEQLLAVRADAWRSVAGVSGVRLVAVQV